MIDDLIGEWIKAIHLIDGVQNRKLRVEIDILIHVITS